MFWFHNLQIAEQAEFFSFGTNDLTQMTFGYSRDDVGKFIPIYLAQGILQHDPFEVIVATLSPSHLRSYMYFYIIYRCEHLTYRLGILHIHLTFGVYLHALVKTVI